MPDRASNRININRRRGNHRWQAFWKSCRVQRWDDHRYYHHSRINQSLHLVSAISFLCAYVLLFTDPAMAALIGWLVAMTSRQVGHFFFEPQGLRRGQPGDPRVQGRDQGRLQPQPQGGAAGDLGAVAAAALLRSDAVRHLRAAHRRPASSSATSALIWLASASAACCSAPCSCSSSRTCRPAWSGSPRSSPTRSTTSSSTTRRRCTCCAAS